MAADGTSPDDQASMNVRTLTGYREIAGAVWDAHACPDGGAYNPFVSHCFLSLLEESGSATARTGWMPCPIVLERAGEIFGVAPGYLKGHSQGEYIFDHHWADAYERAGGRYYPKLLIASPFTPVPGPRLLCADQAQQTFLATGIRQLTDRLGLSSAHVNFTTAEERSVLEETGFLPRLGEQFHWHNRSYQSFDDFLAALASRKRKTIRQERRKVGEAGILIRNISGDDIAEHHWDAFWHFYQDTGARKWGTPYLTREAFSLLGERMADDIVLTLAYADTALSGDPIAGALHFLGSDTLYGRYWGCMEAAKFLHFECCYYQAIDIAIARGLARIEAGAQGSHKLARGYEPVPTFSAHYIPDPSFARAIADYLDQERHGTAQEIEALKDFSPFRKDQ